MKCMRPLQQRETGAAAPQTARVLRRRPVFWFSGIVPPHSTFVCLCSAPNPRCQLPLTAEAHLQFWEVWIGQCIWCPARPVLARPLWPNPRSVR